jgi:CRP/FNR family transcriptional regulator, dissimilatory nitrate respiration regulator
MSTHEWIPAAVRKAGVEHRVSARQALFHRGDRVTSLYEVVEGRFRLVRLSQDGSEIILYTAVAGETIAEASLFSDKYHCDAIAVTDAVVRLYPKAAMLAQFQRSPATAKKYMAMLARQVMELRTRLEQRNIRSARERVWHYLAINVGQDGLTVRLRGTVKELAAELGLTHEVVYRVLSELAANGQIERPEGRVIRLTKKLVA